MTYFHITRPNAPVAAHPLVRLQHQLRCMVQIARSRNALQSLTDAQLADIGIDRATARSEANRPFWDLHPHSVPHRVPHGD